MAKLKADERMYLKADKELQNEQLKQVNILYSAAAIVLWRMGWRQKRITKRFHESILHKEVTGLTPGEMMEV